MGLLLNAHVCRSLYGHGLSKVNWVNIGVWTRKLMSGINSWCRHWRSLQCHQGSSKVNWVNIGIRIPKLVGWVDELIGFSNIQESQKPISTTKSQEPRNPGNHYIWWMGSIHDVEQFKGHVKVIGVIQGEMGKHWSMDIKLSVRGQTWHQIFWRSLQGHQWSWVK